MSVSSILLLAVLIAGALPRENTGFVPGHIFVAVEELEPCDFGGREWIIEIDPDTGAWNIFADSDDGLCVVSGLRFTPDGSRLLAASAGRSWIQAFAPDGSSEVILDASDGLDRPFGSNCLAFDRGGDLYVVSAEDSMILRFPPDGSPGTVFADASDGIDDRGALDFSPSADLYYTGDLAGAILRIDPTGQASVFRDRGSVALLVDPQGNLFAATGGGVIRFDGPNPDPTTRRLLWEPPVVVDDTVGLAISPRGHSLYFAGALGEVYAIDPNSGASHLLADFSALSPLSVAPTGATVHAPDPESIRGRCCFGTGTPLAGCVDGVVHPECGDDEPGPFVFTPKEICPPDGPDCEIETVACCTGDPFGPCTDDTLVTECQCPTCMSDQFRTCAEIECAPIPVPTVSEWGLATLTLSLMIGAKVVFGTGAAAPAA